MNKLTVINMVAIVGLALGLVAAHQDNSKLKSVVSSLQGNVRVLQRDLAHAEDEIRMAGNGILDIERKLELIKNSIDYLTFN